MSTRALQVLVLALIATPALAASATIKPGEAQFVRRDEAAIKEGLALVKSGAHRSDPDRVSALASCRAEPGTRIDTSGGGFFYSTVTVLDGPQAGCRGLLPNTAFESAR